MGVVFYAYKDTPNMSLDILRPVMDLQVMLNKLEVLDGGIYADGFEKGLDGLEPPSKGWERLAEDAKRKEVTHIIMANLSKWHQDPQSLLSDLQPVVNAGTKILVAQAPFINGGVIEDLTSLAQAVVLVESIQYHKDVKGLRIRAGHRATKKNIGNTPYGMKNVKGTLVIDHDEMENVRSIMTAHYGGISVGEIARTFGPDFAPESARYDKVYHIVKYWAEKQSWRSG